MSRKGSTSFNVIVAGNPATLWWVLIRSRSWPPLSIQSGAIVPWTRNSALNLSASRSKTSMNVLPMTARFFSGSVRPLRARKNRPAASTTLDLSRRPFRVFETCSVSPARINPVSTYTARRRSPIARLARTAAVVLSTPPEQAMIAWPAPTAVRIVATCSSMNAFASNIDRLRTRMEGGLRTCAHPIGLWWISLPQGYCFMLGRRIHSVRGGGHAAGPSNRLHRTILRPRDTRGRDLCVGRHDRAADPAHAPNGSFLPRFRNPHPGNRDGRKCCPGGPHYLHRAGRLGRECHDGP